jgi:uncharacterized protein
MFGMQSKSGGMTENRLFKAEVHCFHRNGSWYALDVRRMFVFDLSPLEAEILALPEREIAVMKLNQQLVPTLNNLEKKGLLRHTPEQPLPVKREVSPEIDTLELNIAQDCNLSCKYCFLEKGSFGAKRRRMSAEVALASVDFLLRESRDSENISLIFTGGEPLLNFKAIKSAVEYARVEAERREKKTKFLIATNGTLFNDNIISFIKKNQIEVQVSLDGDEETHDKMRILPNGRGSYNTIKKWLPLLLADYQKKVELRATLTPQTPDFVASFEHLRHWDAGYVRVGHAGGVEAEFRLTNSDCERLKNSYTQLAHLFLEGALRDDISAKGAFLRYILTLCAGHRRSHFCGAAINMFGVSASGKLYPCTDLAEIGSYEVGDVWMGVDLHKLNYWRERLGGVDRIPACQNCWARYLCAGGCISVAIATNDDPWQPDLVECAFNRHIIELSIWLYAELRRRNPGVFLLFFPGFKKLEWKQSRKF